MAGSSIVNYIEYCYMKIFHIKDWFHFSNIYKPQASIFFKCLCEFCVHLIFVEVLQMEKNSHFIEFEVLSLVAAV